MFHKSDAKYGALPYEKYLADTESDTILALNISVGKSWKHRIFWVSGWEDWVWHRYIYDVQAALVRPKM